MEPRNFKISKGILLNNLIIRKWIKSDFNSVQNVLKISWYSAYNFIPQKDLDSYLKEIYSINNLENLFNSKNVICYVAEIDNLVCGWLKLTIDKLENKFYLSSIYVLPQFQSFKIGTNFFEIAKNEAIKNSFNEIYVGVMTQNVKALNWYKKLGFEFFKEEPFNIGNTTVLHLIGRKKL